MGGGDVGLGKMYIAADHFRAGVAQQVLEREYVATVTQVLSGKGVAEPVRIGTA